MKSVSAKNLLVILPFLLYFGAKSGYGLSVTNYGTYQISMVRHGEKYATDRDCYRFEDVQPKYHGMTHVRGPNDKHGSFSFTVDVPVRVHLAVDSRYSYIHGSTFQNTGEIVMLGGCHARTPFYVYQSTSVYGPGVVNINFPVSRMTMVFFHDARLVNPDAELKVMQPPNYGAELSMVRHGEKFSTNRACYQMIDIPARFYGLTHIRLVNDVPSPIVFDVSVPVVVYVAIDSRYANPIVTTRFENTGEKIVHAGCHPRTDFPVLSKRFAPGQVRIEFSPTRMMAVFVEPIVDNTFKSGVY